MTMNEDILIINENTKLSEEQKYLIAAKFKSYKEMKIPSAGWGVEQMHEIISDLKDFDNVIFATSIPYMIKELAIRTNIHVFHEDELGYHLV